MRLLLDQNLSPRLVRALADLFRGSTHVRDVGLSRAADDAMWSYAAQHGCAIVSKDAEFTSGASCSAPRPRSSGSDGETAQPGTSRRYCAGGTRTCWPSTRIQSGRSSRSPEWWGIVDTKPVLGPKGGAHLLRDDYKAPAETIEAALEVLGEIPAGRRLVALGDVSEPLGPARAIYEGIGRSLARVATRAVLVGGTDVRSYRVGATAARMAADAVLSVGRSVHAAAAAIASDLRPEDVVLVKGRDSQRLDRVALLLEGRPVRCELVECNLRLVQCERCPMFDTSV